jgi:septal ring factor EnvC (AmiA/AmiB activator)
MSKLERFIDDHRSDLDDKVPSNKVWENIEAAIITKKEKKKAIITPFVKWSLAAGLILIAAVSVFMFINRSTKAAGPDITIAQPKIDTTIYQLAPDEAPQMNQFAKLIETRQLELKELSKDQPQLYQKFTKDITQLDSSYNALKNQLGATPNKELLIEAMIQNLQLQLQVLNQQLNIINKIKNPKNNSHEKDDQFI